MSLTNTFDTHIKAISTAEEWVEYKAMIMSNAEESLNTKFRSAISHALLGSDCDASRETWELVFAECEKIAKQHTNQTLQELKEKADELEKDAHDGYMKEYGSSDAEAFAAGRIEGMTEITTLIDEAINE